MKNIMNKVIVSAFALVLGVVSTDSAFAQIHSYASAVMFEQQKQHEFWRDSHFETNPGSTASPQQNSISGGGNQFGQHLGHWAIGSGNLRLIGAEVKVTNNPFPVCNAKFYYRVYLESEGPSNAQTFEAELTNKAHCENGTGSFSDTYGPCEAFNDHKYSNLRNEHTDPEHLPVNLDLTTFKEGRNVVEVWYSISDDINNCEPQLVNNGGNNFKAYFDLYCDNVSAPNPPRTQNFCLDANPSPKIKDLSPSGDHIEWYASSTSTTPLDKELLLENKRYFVRRAYGSCRSNAVGVQVNLVDVEEPELEKQNICDIENPTIASLPDKDKGTINWYADEDATMTLNKNTTISKGTYYASQTVMGCESPRVPVDVADDCDCLKVYQLFSPNGNGMNEYFTIECIEKYENTLMVFNRWGNKVYEAVNYKNNWDGTSNARFAVSADNKLPSGTYFYVLKVKGKEPISDWLYLKR
jgi:gliding motility-associated-like protein